MIKSMTGYGVAAREIAAGRVEVEVRALNHKYLDIALRLPRGFTPIEARVRDLVKEKVARGRVELTMRFDPSPSANPRYRIQADLQLAEEYIHLLDEMKERFGLKGEVTLEHIAAVRELILFSETGLDLDPYWEDFAAIIEEALDALDLSRRREGEALAADLMGRVDGAKGLLEEIRKRGPEVVTNYQRRLRERLRVLLEGSQIDEQRFQQEVAYLAERCDIAEETVRIASHLSQFADRIAAGGIVGRGLDFIIQEMNREVNTIGAKANDVEISKRVIALKEELERMREQVQNIE